VIDLHTHTDQSDGTLSPAELVRRAVEVGLEAIGITDHDTFAGYDVCVSVARAYSLEVICGIELSTRRDSPDGKRPASVHLLGYFLDAPPSGEFRRWVDGMLESRRKRNKALIHNLRSLGIDVSLEEVQSVGENLIARPHFAEVLLRKGYVTSIQEAFDLYLADGAKASVEREEPSVVEGIRHIRQGGGIVSLAHPVRICNESHCDGLVEMLEDLVPAGLNAIEVYHSEHEKEDVNLFHELAEKFGLMVTGGSDFHGSTKPGVVLGTGRGNNVRLDYSLLEQMRRACTP
jgi:hypothetical protein